MENATNGLIMAGSVLIGVIVISLFVYLFSSMGSMSKEFQEEMDNVAIEKFNKPFEKYIGRDDLTAHDVVTVYNLVQSANVDEEVVKLTGVSISNVAEFLENEYEYKINMNKYKYKYECPQGKVQYDEKTGKISKIEIKEIKIEIEE